MTTLKPGDKLYHVCDIDPPDQRHTWEVRTEEIEQVRRDGIMFRRMVRGARLHRKHTIGTVYHRAPDDAVRAFFAQQEEAVKAAHRAIAEAERAMTWATRAIDGNDAERREATARLARLKP